MALVILIRHGQTDENVSGKISGQGPAPLNSRGHEQARLAAEVLAPLGVTHLLSSPVPRARQTAEVVAQRIDRPIEEVPSLHEVDYGDWEGSFFQTQRSHPAAHAVFHDPANAVFPNGESLPNVQRRGVESVRGGAPPLPGRRGRGRFPRRCDPHHDGALPQHALQRLPPPAPGQRRPLGAGTARRLGTGQGLQFCAASRQ